MTLLDGSTQFSEDHDGQLPRNYPGYFDGVRDHLSWVSTVLDAPSNLEYEIEGIVQGCLFPYIGDADTYHCPADTRLYDPNQRAFRSYSISHPMGGSYGPSSGPWTVLAEEIKYPASALVFLEEPDPRGTNFGSWTMKLDPEQWIDPVATWHENACNLGFADGHVERHRWQNQSTVDWSTAAQFDDPDFRFEMIPEDGFEDYDYMRSVYEIELNREPEPEPNEPDDGNDGGR